MTEIKETTLAIHCLGDLSDSHLGLQDAEWIITGPLEFENFEDREEFRTAILQSFGILAESVYAEFGSEECPDLPPEWEEDRGCSDLDYPVD